jgi:hypothetical protein
MAVLAGQLDGGFVGLGARIAEKHPIKTTAGPDQRRQLLLLGDAAFGDGVVRNTHPSVLALSTRTFLTTLENYGIITSAAAILQEVADAGRKVAPYRVERPGRLDDGARSKWTSALKPPGP